MRLIVQSVAGSYELCARLGLVFVSAPAPRFFDGGKIIRAVLDGSPGARAGIEHRDIIVSVDGQPWDSVRHMVFSDRRPSEISVRTFVARCFTFAAIAVCVPPEPYRPLDDIAREAAGVIAVRPVPDRTPYGNPRHDDIRQSPASLRRRGRRR